MSNVRGGIDIILDNLKVNITKLKNIEVSQDSQVEVSGTLTVEQ